MEPLNYNLLFHWFVGLNLDDAVWVPTVFSKNRDHLLEGQIAGALMAEVLRAADQHWLLSHENFTFDGTLREAWARHNSVRPKDCPTPTSSDGDPKNPKLNLRNEKRLNATHQSLTHADARISRKSNGTASILGHLGIVAPPRAPSFKRCPRVGVFCGQPGGEHRRDNVPMSWPRACTPSLARGAPSGRGRAPTQCYRMQ